MRVIKKKIDGEKAMLYYEQFESYQEFLKIVEERDRTNAHGEHTLRNNVGDWEGVKDYEEARRLLVNGWDAQVELLKKKFREEERKLGTKEIVKQFSDIVGFMPIVPNVIIGLPNCMLNNRTETKKAKVIKFLIDRTFSCGIDSDDAIEYFSKVLARIATLEKNGYRCRIEMMQDYTHSSWGKTKVAFSMLVKSENQLFDIRRMAFPIAHTAMFRTFGFAWENSLPIDYDSYHQSGLGNGIMYWDCDARNRFLNSINSGNEKIIHVHYGKSLEEIFGKEVM